GHFLLLTRRDVGRNVGLQTGGWIDGKGVSRGGGEDRLPGAQEGVGGPCGASRVASWGDLWGWLPRGVERGSERASRSGDEAVGSLGNGGACRSSWVGWLPRGGGGRRGELLAGLGVSSSPGLH